MTAPSASQRVKLNVTDFGPIAKAEVDLRPMTVFVGPSNTGKSYMAILIYALHSFFGGRIFDLPNNAWNRSIFSMSLRRPSSPIHTTAISSVVSHLKAAISGANKGYISDDHSFVLTQPVALGLLQKHFSDVSHLVDILNGELVRVFGVEDTPQLVRNKSRTGAQFTVTRLLAHGKSYSNGFRYEFNVDRAGPKLRAHIPETGSVYPALPTGDSPQSSLNAFSYNLRGLSDDEDRMRDYAWLILDQTAQSIGHQAMKPLTRTSYYLPADRTGVMHAHRVVVGSLIGQASRAGFQRDTALPRLSGVLADFLTELIDLDDRQESDIGKDLSQQIERNVLQGEVSARRTQVGYPEFLYRPDGWTQDMHLMNASSMVSELAPIVLYLRHVVQPGEVLIIEEPESHLHPAMQVALIRHLAAAVRAGVRVIATTHSEWVLDELTNLVRLSDLPQIRRRDISSGDYALSPDDLGVWLFEPKKRPRGSVVKELRYDEDFGGFRTGFDEVAIGTYNDHAAISNLIAERGPEYKSS